MLETLTSLCLLLALLSAATYAGYRLGRRSAGATPRATPSIIVLRQQLQRLAELATVSYRYTDLARHDKTASLLGLKMPFGASHVSLLYSGTVKAGYDLAQAHIEVDRGTVRLLLPEPRVLSHEIDPSTLRVVDEHTGLLTRIKADDLVAFCAEHKDAVERQAEVAQLLEEARRGLPAAMALLKDGLQAHGCQLLVEQGTWNKEHGTRNMEQ